MSTDPTLVEAAESGDRLASLRALRNVLAREIVGAEQARDVASLSGRLTAVMAEIAELEPPEQKAGTPLDELHARRAARPAAPTGTGRAAKPAH